MKGEFLKKFSKDLDNIKTNAVKQSVIRLIELMELADALEDIPNTKKLSGHKSAYRTRIGDYRLGFFFEDSSILLARILHRNDIYKMFP